MASSDLELEQWMPALFLSEDHCFSNEQLAIDFAQTVLAIHQQALISFQQQTSLAQPPLEDNETIMHYANGYLQAFIFIDHIQGTTFPAGSSGENLQQTCLLLLDKLATGKTDEVQKLTLFAQLPTNAEILQLLPTLLSRYGHLCLMEKS